MKRLAILALVVFGVAAASAGVTEWSAWWVDNSPLDLEHSGWSFDWGTETWNVWERYVAPEIDESITGCGGQADVDPLISIVKTITNDSTFEWTDYHVAVTGSAGVSYVPGSATSNVFGTIVENGNMIDFFAPNSVPIGGSVTIAFDVQVPAGGFTFDISQTPTPEPASALLFGLGALLLRRR